ncbi:MAG: C40 family peptidase [Actinomycetota bacterium]
MGRHRFWARVASFALASTLVVAIAPVAEAGGGGKGSTWQDVQPGSRGWFAKPAIDDVAKTHDWMRDFGLTSFHPTDPESRGLLARAVSKAFAPTATPKRTIEFEDLAADDPLYPFAALAVSNGWMSPNGRRFAAAAPVTEFMVSKAIVRALGLQAAVDGANHIHTSDGTPLPHSPQFGTLLIGRVIGLWRNHEADVKGDSEAFDLLPTSPVPRADVAYALHRAADLGSSAHWYTQDYEDLDVGTPPPAMVDVIEFGMKYVGYPYVYAGEWNTATTNIPYCCGAQLQGGFDCSGFTWWIMRAGDGVWNNEAIRGYHGWELDERSSSLMAGATPKKRRVSFAKLQAGDLMFYGSGSTAASVDHVDTYIGNGWALDSGGNGVSIVRVADGWYRDSFVFGRRMLTP